MSIVLRLALRNLRRSPRRTVLTAIAVVFGVAFSIIGRGFVSGTQEGFVVAATDDTVGHVMARPADYPDRALQYPINALLNINDRTYKLLEESTVGWTTRTYFAPLAAHGHDSLRVMAIGIDPQRDEQVFARTHWQIEGTLPTGNDHAIAVGPRVARLLGIKVGDQIILQVRTHRGAINALAVSVTAILRTGNMALDSRGIWMSQHMSATLIAAEAPSHLAIKLRRRDDSLAFAPRLQNALGAQAETITWQTETAELLRLQEIRRKALDAIVFVLMALSAFGIANTILMSAHERIREVGTLRSMGMTEGGVIKLFMFEGALMGALGGILGALMGGGAVGYWARNPMDFSEMFEQQASTISISSLVYTSFDINTILASVAVAVVVATLASVFPARVASRMVPAEAVRASQ